jgi:hypothetical protein
LGSNLSLHSVSILWMSHFVATLVEKERKTEGEREVERVNMTCELFNNLHTLLSAGVIGKGLAFQLTIENEQPNILIFSFPKLFDSQLSIF